MIWVDVINDRGELVATTEEIECSDLSKLTLVVKEYGEPVFETAVTS